MEEYRNSIVIIFILYMCMNESLYKLFIGVILGIYISTKYDFKPYTIVFEEKIKNIIDEFQKIQN